ncbi:TIGR03086 family metal-binding protein [Streptomyces sp. NBC_01005]|uniref:TIGR03086 family metal-binding protein n=1 Tax=unclassified Streptomyces TaxID=2593676 RepID=UPI0038663C7C|nr:TIGR03086 family metal-binding protein [Streptomyces sp. NBC_01005]WTC96406.1 TIGR03086 family metal-binding protein [Streptomyces sp. NBC_01650]
MSYRFAGIIDRYLLSGSEFTRRLRAVRPEQWTAPTPCAEWDVRHLVNHMTRGNLNYVSLLDGGSAADFLRLRDEDALGRDPVGAYVRSVRECAEAFRRPGALQQILDYPLGPVTGEQALAVRTTDATLHTWDLARAVNAPEKLAPELVAWIEDNLAEIYAGLAESPVSADTTHRFFAVPGAPPVTGEARQARLLRLMGR